MSNNFNSELEEESSVNIGRAIWQKPGLVIEKLGDISDKVIADIGAGTGYFSLRLAPRAKSDRHRNRACYNKISRFTEIGITQRPTE
ncbi:MAG: hypothetical protein IPJ39_19500 [Saprospiraceae bacterium]|nr:hypothetical protein [Saprospiraceae bacterium]